MSGYFQNSTHSDASGGAAPLGARIAVPMASAATTRSPRKYAPDPANWDRTLTSYGCTTPPRHGSEAAHE